MPRPWIEGAVLLAAHGFTADPGPAGPVNPPRNRARPNRRPVMTDAATPSPAFLYALFRRLDGFAKPSAFDDVHALARAIERERDGRAVQLVEIEDFEMPGDDLLHTAVEIWALDASHDRDQRIGVAWLNESGRDVLEPALRAARADRPRAQPQSRHARRAA